MGATRILDSYRYFEELFRRPSTDLNQVYQGLSKLMVVEISLDRAHDNPQLIFESLNSTGMDLSQADLIRNYVLMGLEIGQQTELYNRYWYPMEVSFGDHYGTDFDYFMRDYLTLKSRSGTIANVGKVYEKFKEHRHERAEETISEVVADIYRYARYYARLAYSADPDPDINAVMRDINTLEIDVAYPLLLELYGDFEAQQLTRADFLAILRLIESYVFRRAICDIPTNSLNKTFATLSRDLDKDHYLESVQAVLLLKDSYRRFPRDDEFAHALTTRNIYDLSKRRGYLFSKLENLQHKEPINIKDYSIEHVLPQNEQLAAEWRAMLGADWQQVQSTYLHTLGNLTLTAYNSELSDHPFITKRDMPGGFKDSHLRLNADLAELDTWDEAHIKRRATRLASIALRVWTASELGPEILDRYRKAGPRTATETPRALKDGNYFGHLHGEIQTLFEALRSRILLLDASVREDPKLLYIAYRNATNFVAVEPQKTRLRLMLNLTFDEIHDPLGLCSDVVGAVRWGNGNVQLGMTSLAQLDDVMALVRQSFDKHCEEPDE